MFSYYLDIVAGGRNSLVDFCCFFAWSKHIAAFCLPQTPSVTIFIPGIIKTIVRKNTQDSFIYHGTLVLTPYLSDLILKIAK